MNTHLLGETLSKKLLRRNVSNEMVPICNFPKETNTHKNEVEIISSLLYTHFP